MNEPKIKFCKKHSKLIGGGIDLKDIKNTRKCCTNFIVIDKDDLSYEKTNKIKSLCNKLGNVFILLNPLFEINLLSAFNKVSCVKSDKLIYQELNKQINVSHYKDKKIDNRLKIIEIIKKENLFEKWKRNLKLLKEKEISNFIDLIEFFK